MQICIYVTRGMSIYSDENLFHAIENDIANFKGIFPDHRSILGEDFNAYTNTEPDFIQFDSASNIIDDDDYIEDTLLPERANLDNREPNADGNSLIMWPKNY